MRSERSGRIKKIPRRRARRTLLGLILLVLTVGVTIGLILYNNSVTQQVAATTAKTAKMEKDVDAQIAAIKKRKAEEKIAQEKAAKEAAEAAQSATQSTASTVNSSACNTAKTHNNPNSIDVVVNKKHCMQPVTFEPGDLTTSNGATLSAKAINAYNQLFNAAAAAGQPFYVTSSYRSYGDQVSTYNYWVSVSGKDGADTYSARPGYSEHQTGLAFDVAAGSCALDCFGSTSQYQWLQQHAAEYGFIQRYYAGSEAITGYKAEEWHYRYVGVAVAKDMQAKGIKTLEEYWNISGGGYY